MGIFRCIYMLIIPSGHGYTGWLNSKTMDRKNSKGVFMFNAMKKMEIMAILILALMVVTSCDDDGDDLLALSGIVADPVPVAIQGDVGTLTFDFTGDPLAVDNAF